MCINLTYNFHKFYKRTVKIVLSTSNCMNKNEIMTKTVLYSSTRSSISLVRVGMCDQWFRTNLLLPLLKKIVMHYAIRAVKKQLLLL